jgi:O-antigen/teichoic acid export membrane protein
MSDVPRETYLEDALPPSLGLAGRVVRGGAWVFGLRAIQKVLDVIRLAVVARILAPADLGLMGIAVLTHAVLQTFSETGLLAALVHKRTDIRPYLNVVWTVLIARGAILCALMAATAPLVAAFFDMPTATGLIRTLALAFLIQAFGNPGVIAFQKELQFDRQFVLRISAGGTVFAATVVAVVVLRSVWALVIGQLAGHAVTLLLSYVLHPFRPRLSLEMGRVKELWKYGRWVFVSTGLQFALKRGDALFVGKLLGAAGLGLYQMAHRMAGLPVTEYSEQIARVLFPAYAKLQHNVPRLREAYLKTLQFSALICCPTAGGVFIMAHELTHVLLGDQWAAAAPVIQVLSLLGLFTSLANSGPLFLAIGTPQRNTKLQVLRLVLIVALIYPLTSRYGMAGTAAALCVGAAASEALSLVAALNAIEAPVTRALGLIALPVGNTGVMMGCVHLLKTHWLDGFCVPGFVTAVVAGIGIYLAGALVSDLAFHAGNGALVLEQWAIFRSGPTQGRNAAPRDS